MNVVSYTEDYTEEWDNFLATSFNGTFLHSRRYLSYHGSRLKDASLLILDDKNNLVGILPAAADPDDPTIVISHPGITYGGLIHATRLRGARLLNSFESILETYSGLGFKNFIYKSIPRVYQLVPSEDDLYALFRLGAERTRCDLSTAINFNQREVPSDRRKRAFKKAIKSGIMIRTKYDNLKAFWEVLSENLSQRHGVAPVHTFEEMWELGCRFPKNITLVTGFFGDQLVAGTIVFRTKQTDHTQYLASSELGKTTGALDLLVESCIERAINDGKRFFSFGISSESSGKVLNEGLNDFKVEFGGGGIVHEFYRIQL